RVAQREVIGGGRGLRLSRVGRWLGRSRARARGKDHGGDGRDGGQQETRDADGAHHHLPETTAVRPGRLIAIRTSSLTARSGWPSRAAALGSPWHKAWMPRA